jgi:hypothetical protein
MNRFAIPVALIVVLAVVSAMSASFSGTSLALVTVLVAAGVLVHGFASSAQAAEAGSANTAGLRSFAGHLVRNVLRFSIGAVVIAWMVVGLQWSVSG